MNNEVRRSGTPNSAKFNKLRNSVKERVSVYEEYVYEKSDVRVFGYDGVRERDGLVVQDAFFFLRFSLLVWRCRGRISVGLFWHHRLSLDNS